MAFFGYTLRVSKEVRKGRNITMNNEKDASAGKSGKEKIESLVPPELEEAELESISGGYLINKGTGMDEKTTTPPPTSQGVMAPGTSCH
jgi:hypothetical protein